MTRRTLALVGAAVVATVFTLTLWTVFVFRKPAVPPEGHAT